MTIRIESGAFTAVIGALFVFGFLYNLLVGWLQSRGYDEGYTALLVVAGVAVTLLGLAFISIEIAITAFLTFAASGFWMVVGSMWRYVKRREASQKAIRDEATRLAE